MRILCVLRDHSLIPSTLAHTLAHVPGIGRPHASECQYHLCVSADMTAYAIVWVSECVRRHWPKSTETERRWRWQRWRRTTHEKSFGMEDGFAFVLAEMNWLFSRYFRLNEASQHISFPFVHINGIFDCFAHCLLVFFALTLTRTYIRRRRRHFPLAQFLSPLSAIAHRPNRAIFIVNIDIHARIHAHTRTWPAYVV